MSERLEIQKGEKADPPGPGELPFIGLLQVQVERRHEPNNDHDIKPSGRLDRPMPHKNPLA